MSLTLDQVGPRRYRGEFPVWGNGHYHIMASAVGGGRSERALGRFVVPYSPEYLRFRANPIVLKQIAQRTGGRVLEPTIEGKDLFIKEREPKASSQPAFDWFLVVLAFMIPLDVAIRRIQIDWFVIRSWLGLDRKVGDSGETLGALLRRKESIEFGGGAAPESEGRRLQPASAPPPKPAPPRPTTDRPKPRPEREPAPDEPEGDSATTTGRLLRMKKKWKK